MSRGLKMLAMVQGSSSEKEREKAALIKILELNEFSVCYTRELEKTSMPNVFAICHKGKTCRAIIVSHGDNPATLQKLLEDVKRYENVLAKYHNLQNVSVSVQASPNCQTAFTQTDNSISKEYGAGDIDITEHSETQEELVGMDTFKGVEVSPCSSENNPVHHLPVPKKPRKKHYCKFCRTLIGNFTRHFLNQHPGEQDCIQYNALTCKKEKLKKIKEIMAEGDYLYNQRNPTNVIIRRKTSLQKKQHSRLPCPSCKAMISSLNLTRHFKTCGTEGKSIRPRAVSQLSHRLVAQNISAMSECFKNNIWPAIREDNVKEYIKSDENLIAFGNQLCQRYEADNQSRFIRQVLRSISRVALAMIRLDGQDNNPVKTASDFFCPNKYNLFVEGVKSLCRSGEGVGGSYKSPAVVNQYAAHFRKFSNFMYQRCIISNDINNTRKKIKDWQRLYDTSFNIEVGAQARKQAEKMTALAKSDIPSSADVKKLSDFISEQANAAFNDLNSRFNYESYILLGKALLLKLWLFNRKRVAEVDRLRLDDWTKRAAMDTDSDAYRTLTKSERLFSTSFKRITVRGKLNRLVGLLLHTSDEPKFELYIKERQKANIHPNNPYLFAIQSTYLEGTKIMREFSSKCGAKNPHLLRGTKLRRHFATMVQCLNLTDEDLQQVARCLGHTDKTHITTYRGDHGGFHMGRYSKLLSAFDQDRLEEIIHSDIKSLELADDEPEDFLGDEDPNYLLNPWEPEPTLPGVLAGSSITESEDELVITPQKLNQPSTSKIKRSKEMDSSDESWRPQSDESEPTPHKVREGRVRKFSKRLPHAKQKWDTPMKDLLWSEFREEISKGKLPSVGRCKLFIRENEERFPNRTAEQLKTYIYNMCKKLKNQFQQKNSTPKKKILP